MHLIAGTEVYEKGCERFNFKPLPKENWHYLWETYDGNTYEVRRQRAKRLLELASRLGIKVTETNISEGKESAFAHIGKVGLIKDKVCFLKEAIDRIQQLPEKRKTVLRKRKPFQWLILSFVGIHTFFYIVYFWLFMIMRNKVLLGGRKK